MAYTYSKIATYTVGSGGISSVWFLNIPQTYTDLVLKGSARTTQAAHYGVITIYPNGISSGLTGKNLYGGDNVVESDTSTGVAYVSGNNATANTFGTFQTYFPNYTGTNYKSMSSEGAAESNSTTNTYMKLGATLWSNTQAITSLQILPTAINFMQYSTFHLYGIKAEL